MDGSCGVRSALDRPGHVPDGALDSGWPGLGSGGTKPGRRGVGDPDGPPGRGLPDPLAGGWGQAPARARDGRASAPLALDIVLWTSGPGGRDELPPYSLRPSGLCYRCGARSGVSWSDPLRLERPGSLPGSGWPWPGRWRWRAGLRPFAPRGRPPGGTIWSGSGSGFAITGASSGRCGSRNGSTVRPSWPDGRRG